MLGRGSSVGEGCMCGRRERRVSYVREEVVCGGGEDRVWRRGTCDVTLMLPSRVESVVCRKLVKYDDKHAGNIAVIRYVFYCTGERGLNSLLLMCPDILLVLHTAKDRRKCIVEGHATWRL